MVERTWRQGYVPGKAKKTIHIDDEVARVLEIRAAEERVSQSEIVERALRKELGLMEVTVNIIEVGAPGENHAERVASFTATLTGSHDEMIEQAIRLAEERGYTVVRNDAGGCCEVTEYSDGTVAVGITVEAK